MDRAGANDHEQPAAVAGQDLLDLRARVVDGGKRVVGCRQFLIEECRWKNDFRTLNAEVFSLSGHHISPACWPNRKAANFGVRGLGVWNLSLSRNIAQVRPDRYSLGSSGTNKRRCVGYRPL